MVHASTARSNNTQSGRQNSGSVATCLDACSYCGNFVPSCGSLAAVRECTLQSQLSSFSDHKRLWQIAERICPIFEAVSLHSPQKEHRHQTEAAKISLCHPNSWHQMAMISLPWLLKHQTFPVKTSSIPRCSNFPSAKRQCPSCSVKLHLNISIVCNLSNLSQWNISKRYRDTPTTFIFSSVRDKMPDRWNRCGPRRTFKARKSLWALPDFYGSKTVVGLAR